MTRTILLAVLLATLWLSAQADDYAIGVLAFSGENEAVQRWQPTADYLSQRIHGARFHIIPLTHDEFEHAINKDKLDFVLTNPGHYVLLEVRFGVTRIATFLSSYRGQTLKQFSSVIFTRQGGRIERLSDLRGGSLAAVSEQAFGGFQLAQLELERHGIDVPIDVNVKWLGFPHADVVRAVLNGRADAGTVRTGVLEGMAEKGVLSFADIHVLGQRANDGFPLLHSVDLHPEWPFSRLPRTDIDLAKRVAVNLMNMEPDNPAAIRALGAGWTIPLDYASVHQVLRELKVAPYQPTAHSLTDFLYAYRGWIVALLLLLFVTLIAVLRLVHTNRQLQSAQRSLQQQQLFLEETVQERTDELLQTNQALQVEIASHVQAEHTLNEGCKSLQSLYEIFIRDDLDRKQKLNSVLDTIRQHVGADCGLLSIYREGRLESCCVSPGNAELEIPLSAPLSQQAIDDRQVLIREHSDRWRYYICSPVYLNERLICLLELASAVAPAEHADNEGEQPMSSELGLRILTLVSHWVANEIQDMEKEAREQARSREVGKRFTDLSARETQVLELLVQGESTKEMARQLNISTKTVDMHRANLLRKTLAKSSTELVQLAVNSGIFNETR